MKRFVPQMFLSSAYESGKKIGYTSKQRAFMLMEVFIGYKRRRRSYGLKKLSLRLRVTDVSNSKVNTFLIVSVIFSFLSLQSI